MAMSPNHTILMTVDDVLAALALLLLGWVLLSWARRSPGREPRLFPDRPNDLREDVLVVVILFYFLSFVVFDGLVKLIMGGSDGVAERLFVNTATQVVGVVLCLLVGARRFGGGLRRFLVADGGIRVLQWVPMTLVLLVLALGLCPLVANRTVELILLFSPEYEFATHPTIDALHDPALQQPVVAMFWMGAVVVAPISEELFFRGLVQTYLLGFFRRRWLALACSAVAFGLVHSSQLQAVGALSVLGVILGFAYERTGSLIPPIIIHAVFNLRTLIWDALSEVVV